MTLTLQPPSPIGGGMRRHWEASMISGQTRTTLYELRRKTDRQLLALVRSGIKSSLRQARSGAIAEAEEMWNQARGLLAVARAPQRERIALEARLDEARASFAPKPAATRYAQSACC
jgi:hypothetical protein